jgi:hypothetical protein
MKADWFDQEADVNDARVPSGRSDEYYLAMAALDQYPIKDGLPKSTSVVYRIHQLGRSKSVKQ